MQSGAGVRSAERYQELKMDKDFHQLPPAILPAGLIVRGSAMILLNRFSEVPRGEPDVRDKERGCKRK